MQALRSYSLATGIVLVLSPLLLAQGRPGFTVKKKEVSPEQYEKLEESWLTPAASADALHPGDLVTVKRKGDDKGLHGVFVYEDAKKNTLYLRIRPGVAPVAVGTGDITEVERIVPAAGKGEKGEVLPAVEAETMGYAGEIHALTIWNGTTKIVHYFGPTLSPAERSHLALINHSAERVARDEELIVSLEALLDSPPADNNGGAWNTGGMGGYPWLFPFYHFDLPDLHYFIGPWYYPFFAQQQSTVVTSSAPNPQDVLKSLAAARETLQKDQQDAQQARARAVVDDEGHIIAIRSDEK